MSDRSKEFRLTADQFQRIRRRIGDYAGISLAETKQDMVYGRLIRRLRALGCAGFDDYLERVEGDVGGERQRFVNALTTNLTAFFREAHHFEVLREVLAGYGRQRLRIWCSAASTGEEPQSIAMTVVEHYRSWTPPVEIIATDIDTQVLDQCRQGVYPIERIDELSTARRQQFFLRGTGPMAGKVRVRPELARLTRFEPFNLLAPDWSRFRGVDVVFCRNVMIYFDKPTQTQVLQQFHRCLNPGGWLFVGHSESQAREVDGFASQGHTVYRSRAAEAAA
ncbi:CheR family methyltransferase [Abyssibacter sp.]|uniref:CheR family methyltransferase n=1 Tax=Abyssibacter sp. TaxID=2320200 RepID=UPI0035124056